MAYGTDFAAPFLLVAGILLLYFSLIHRRDAGKILLMMVRVLVVIWEGDVNPSAGDNGFLHLWD